MSDCTCVRGDDGQVRVPRSRCPQHGWADTPTPAPALTDEQIEALWRYLYITVAGCSERLIDPQDLDLLYNAVVARAKREERERIAGELEAAATGMGDDLDDYGRGLRNGLRLASRRAEGGATR